MKKNLHIFSIFIILISLIFIFSINISAANNGAKFTSLQHAIAKPLDFMPRTFDVDIFLPKNHNDRGGVIFGSYGSGTDCINFEIYNNGIPRLYYVDQSGTVYNYLFSNVDVRSDNGPVRLTMVQDPIANKITCYINGIVKQSIDSSDLRDDIIINRKQFVGGDGRGGNGQYFKGLIYSLNIHSEALTSDQVKSKDNAGLMISYNFSSTKDQHLDLTGNGYHIQGNLQIANSDDLFEKDELIEGGLSFDNSIQYITSDNGLYETPYTYSAWVYLPKNQADRGGVIIGNYETGGATCVNIEIYTSGSPRFYHIDSNNRIIDAVFSNVDIRKGDWVHLAFTISDVVTCYVNGEKVGQRSIGNFDVNATNIPIAVGGDLRSGNAQYFKGKIKEITLFKEKLSDEDISSLYNNGITSFNYKVLAHYDMYNAESGNDIDDKSDNQNTIYARTNFFESKDAVEDFEYSFIFVGDTQIITESYPDKLSNIYDWIINNKDNKRIEFVFGLGDITNSDTDREWNTALSEISKLNGIVPYSLVRGNHDSVEKFSKYLSTNVYKNQFNGFYEYSIVNSWRTFKAGKVNYLHITLDYGPDDNVLNWASKIIDAHPYHQVIITTHAYMFRDGTTLDDKDVCPPSLSGGVNDGDDIWSKLISKHENIVLVVSGHDPCDKIIATQTKGEKGNIITQILIDPQGVDSSVGATGMIAIFHFSADGSEVQIEYYSTVQDKYFLKENQFNLSLPISHINTENIEESNVENLDSSTVSQADNLIDENDNRKIITWVLTIIIIISLLYIIIRFILKSRRIYDVK